MKQCRLIESNNTGSRGTMNFIKDALEQCSRKHLWCHTSTGSHTVPTRLLKIYDDHVQLVEPSNPRKKDYTCLAHRWASEDTSEGENQKAKSYIMSRGCQTLRFNHHKHLQGLSINELLPTYRDAIFVTKALGLEYLWIDSLCIIQDNDEDVRIQIAQMGNIYANSYVTIAADTGNDHTRGFLSTRNWKWRAHHEAIPNPSGPHHSLYFRERPTHRNLSWSGLFSRAWCLQERLLSTRIVRFQTDEVIVECNQDLVCECGSPPAGHQGPWENLSDLAHLHDKPAFARHVFTRTAAQDNTSWHDLVHAYSQTHLTRETDRMNAFAGIVSRFQGLMGKHCRYLAGLWSKSLLRDMLWYTSTPSIPLHHASPATTVPSWSWMSIPLGDTHIRYPNLPVVEIFPRLRDIHCQPKSTDLPLGDVAIGAYIDLEGQLTPIKMCSDGSMSIASVNFAASSSNMCIAWDPGRHYARYHDHTVFLLKVASLGGGEAQIECFLVVTLLDGAGAMPHFMRVGYLVMSSHQEDELKNSLFPLVQEYQVLRIY